MHANHKLNIWSSRETCTSDTEMHENCVLWQLQSASFKGKAQSQHSRIFGSGELDLNLHYPNLSYLIRILLNPSLHCVQSDVSSRLIGESLEIRRRRKHNSVNVNCIRHADNRAIWNQTSKQTNNPASLQVTTFVLNQLKVVQAACLW